MRRLVVLVGLATLALAGFAVAAGLFTVSISASSRLVTVSWSPPTGAQGYLFLVDGTQVSRTFNATQASATFAKQSGTHTYTVEYLTVGGQASGSYPAATTTTSTTETTTTVTSSTVTTTTVAGPAQVFLSPTGTDSTCQRGNPALPCATFEQADSIAHPGDIVSVEPGNYGPGAKNYGYGTYILDSNPVTFECASTVAGSVTFTDSGFLVGPGGANVTFQGSCFHFHILAVGLRGYDSSTSQSNLVHDVTVDGGSMDSFDITGAKNVTVENAQIGPIDACFGSASEAASYGAPASAACQPSIPVEAFWASSGGTAGLQDEPFVHSNGSDIDTNVTFDHDTFTGMQTRWPSYFHQGGLLIWSGINLTISNSTFVNNTIYNIEFNAGGTNVGTRLINNTFGVSDYTLADPNPGSPLPNGQCQDGVTTPGGTFTNDVIQGNTWVQCFEINKPGIGGSYTNVTVLNNVIGPDATCPATPGVTYSGNTSNGKPVCG